MGRLTREQALDQLRKSVWADLDVFHDVAFVARKLDYTVAELDALTSLPPLWYSDYPRRQQMLGLAYNTFRFFAGRRKASNF